MKTKKFTTSQLTILGLMAGILFLMAYTPLGYLNIGPLAVTFNVIPVAVCAIVLGPTGGAIAGAVFGLTSFMQAIGIGGVSALGSALFQINPFMTAVQCVLDRVFLMVSVLDSFTELFTKRQIRMYPVLLPDSFLHF